MFIHSTSINKKYSSSPVTNSPNLALIYSSTGYKLSLLQNYEQWNDTKTISSKIQEKLVKKKSYEKVAKNAALPSL